jgi:SAM-dependent methyltransferase
VIDNRTSEELRKHYIAEKKLAAVLMQATKEERQELYSEVYDELFRCVPDHPQHQETHRSGEEYSAANVRMQLRRVKHYCSPGADFLELGSGDCRFAIAMTEFARRVYAVDVSAQLSLDVQFPSNMELRLTKGSSIPLESSTIDFCYSNQFIEHLHPCDAVDHLREVHRVLKPGSAYLCVTPNSLNGPHDVSRDFDKTATGLHLKEYTTTELMSLFLDAGFGDLRCLRGVRGFECRIPARIIVVFERWLGKRENRARELLGRSIPGRVFLSNNLLGFKLV